jgi:hypothetical protein
MKIRSIKVFTFLLLLLTGFLVSTFAEGDKDNNKKLDKPTAVTVRTYLDINNILTVLKDDGISDIDINEQNSGLVFPKGSGKTAVFTSGLLWGCLRGGTPQVGGTAYRTGQQSGKITNSGVPVGSLLAGPETGIFRVRSDVYPGGPSVNLSSDASLEAGSESALRAQYELDWTNWPAADGAPFDDVDSNGVYDPTIDIPGVPGANQTIWFVSNDLNSSRTQNLYGADPLGIEMQATYWAYSQTGALGSMYFRKYKLINKSDTMLDSMYVSMWSDVDLGNSTDDYAGCDVGLSLGYCYNANANDATYNPLPPPAVGFDFFQGPVTASGDTLPMTAYYYFARGDANVTDPTQGDIQGSFQFYNFFQGKIGKTGASFVNPVTGLPTSFALSGDPQAGTGWLDGQLLPSGDRRIGSASGPFQFGPGDEQEIVVAEIVAGAIPGVDRISAVGLLKYYDQIAQVAYDNNFDLPVPPPAPSVTTTELDKEIVLDWSKDNSKVVATETSNSKGYGFQGYNVYQLPSASASVSEGTRVATYDIIDGVGKVFDLVFDIGTGSVVTLPVQFGNDTGLKRYISITSDALHGGTPLINGIRYYFAVTAYNYNPDLGVVPNNLENPISIITVVPHSTDPGVTLGEGNGSELAITHNGTADGGPTVTVVDPAATTGDNYEVYFSDRAEIRDQNGDWVAASIISRKLGPNSPDTLTGSSIDASAVYGPQAGKLELQFSLDLVSVDFDWSDGISLKFPAGVTVLEAPGFDAGNGSITPVILQYGLDSAVVNLGDVSHPYTGNGPFTGGETWSIVVEGAVPMPIDWVIYDDGYGGGPVDAAGTTTLIAVGNKQRLAKYWNLKNTTNGSVMLEDQSVINGIDIFPDRDDIITNYGTAADPTVDGFQIGVNVGYDAPLTYSANNPPSIDGTPLSFTSGGQWVNDNYTINDFIYFGYADGTVATTLGPAGYVPGAGGSTDLNELQQDYELRWTGVLADTVLGNGDTLQYTQSGGQLITLIGASGYDIADHPFNPTGTGDPFTIRVPFEIWNVDTGEQINAVMWDRTGNPTVSGGTTWLTTNREYIWLVNSTYAGAVIDPLGPELTDHGTWNMVFYKSTFNLGDVLSVSYDNPIQIGTDTYTYQTTGAAYSNQLAADQVNKINVFPNPYYGVNSEELNKYNRFVTFSHLPTKATIRIFNLAGVLVRTIEKDGNGQFQRWDLANESGLPVASGLYIAYIDMPEVGTTKILKVAIVQEQQILDRF